MAGLGLMAGTLVCWPAVAWAWTTVADTAAPLAVDVASTQPTRPGENRLIVLTLQNHHDRDTISAVLVTLRERGLADVVVAVADLGPGQSASAEFDVAPTAAEPIVLVGYTWQGAGQSIAKAVPLMTPPPEQTNPTFAVLVPYTGPILGLIGVVVGQVLAFRFARVTQRDRDAVELRRSYWDKHGVAYLEFLANLNSESTDPALVREAYAQLAPHWVEPRVRAAYETTLAKLRGPDDPASKRKAVTDLRAAVDEFIARLGPNLDTPKSSETSHSTAGRWFRGVTAMIPWH